MDHLVLYVIINIITFKGAKDARRLPRMPPGRAASALTRRGRHPAKFAALVVEAGHFMLGNAVTMTTPGRHARRLSGHGRWHAIC
jgi:hypothetical protein